MKKAIFVLAILAFSTTAFAASKTYTSGSVYSIGSVTPTPFKTSPKVTINMYTDSLTVGTDWAAYSVHQSAINNAKGVAYWTSKSDPGIYYKKGITAVPSAPSDSTKPTDYTAEGN